MEGFDPTKNEDDKLLLDEIVHNTIKKLAVKMVNAGKLEINGKTYDFMGVNAWVEIYTKWFERKRKELSDKIDGYTKANRWDEVAKEVIRFQDLIPAEKTAKTQEFADSLTKIMSAQEVTPMDPLEVEKELDTIYKTIQDNVFKKLFKEEIAMSELPAVWDGFIRHINAQQASAINFYSLSPEMNTIIFEAGQEAKRALLAKS